MQKSVESHVIAFVFTDNENPKANFERAAQREERTRSKSRRKFDPKDSARSQFLSRQRMKRT
jgi:hypothetical protein